MVMYNANFFINFISNENFKIPKYKLLYILLMHVIEYYFYVN